LQGGEYLDNLLYEIQKTNTEVSSKTSIPLKNVFLKIAPDLEEKEIKMIFQSAVRHGLTGIIAANTTLSREGISAGSELKGGLSGKPLKAKADSVLITLNDLKLNSGSNIILIASGGVFTRQDYLDKIESGAELVQVYTGFIYEGAGIVKKILN
jgi:dihydroorotate dehydrogenase